MLYPLGKNLTITSGEKQSTVGKARQSKAINVTENEPIFCALDHRADGSHCLAAIAQARSPDC